MTLDIKVIEYDTIRDFLHKILDARLRLNVIDQYRGSLWRMMLFPAMNLVVLVRCTNVVKNRFLRIDPQSGKIEGLPNITVETSAFYFVVMRPKRYDVIDEWLDAQEKR